MKKITLLGIVVAMAMGFVSCKKENPAQEETSGNLIKETFSAGFVQKDTRTTISDDAATVGWSQNDKVYYYTKDGGTVRNYTIKAAGEKATLVLEREKEDTYFNLVYAGKTAPTFTTTTGTSMVFDGVKAEQDGTFANANVSVGRTVPGGSGITFKPVVSLVKFTTARTDIKTIVLTGGNGETVAGNISVNPAAASPVAVLSGEGSTSITVTIATPAAGTYYIGVIPGEYLNGLNLLLKDSNGAVIAEIAATNITDLTAGDAMINYGDVDSHVVLLPGKFSVSATKQVQFTRGNLYWNGSDYAFETEQTGYDKGTYDKIEETTIYTPSHVSHFYCTNSADYASGVKPYAESHEILTHTSSDKLWCSEGNSLLFNNQSGLYVLTKDEWCYLLNYDPSLNDGAGGLKTDGNVRQGKFKNGVTVNGDAGCLVIAPDNYSGTIADSYDAAAWASAESDGLVCLPAAGFRGSSQLYFDMFNIYCAADVVQDGFFSTYYCLSFWSEYDVVPDSKGEAENAFCIRLVYSEAPVYPEAPELACVKIGDVWWAPVNCGYDATHPYGLLYQWGRKYGQAYESGTITPTVMTKADDTAANSGMFGKYDSSTYNWFSGTVDNTLWNGGSKGASDPCPTGWRVPTSTELNALLGGNSSPVLTTVGGQKGTYFNGTSNPGTNGVFLPAAGYRRNDNGEAINRDGDAYGCYWSSSVNDYSARYLSFYDGGAGIYDDGRASGNSVRCVLDVKAQGPVTQQYGGGSAEEWF